MSKTSRIAVMIIGILIVILGVSLMLNKDALDERKTMAVNAEIILKASGEEKVLSFDEIKMVGEENFEAVLDTSNSDPVTYSYTGVQLKDVLKASGVDLEGKTTVVLSAVDGFTVAYTLDEVMKDKNVYVTYKQEGEMLKGREEGGSGPYVTIVVSDTFSSRRCKWLTSIEVQ